MLFTYIKFALQWKLVIFCKELKILFRIWKVFKIQAIGIIRLHFLSRKLFLAFKMNFVSDLDIFDNCRKRNRSSQLIIHFDRDLKLHDKKTFICSSILWSSLVGLCLLLISLHQLIQIDQIIYINAVLVKWIKVVHSSCTCGSCGNRTSIAAQI